MSVKLSLGLTAGLLGALVLAVMRPWRGFGVARLRNAQGVGPSHLSGVPRGETRVLKDPVEEPTSVAGRIAGSVDPQ